MFILIPSSNKYLQCVLCDMRITYLRQHLFINIKIPKKETSRFY